MNAMKQDMDRLQELVVDAARQVRNQPALYGVAHRLVALVVLIEDVAALNPAVFVDHQHGLLEKGQLAYGAGRQQYST